MYRHSYKLQAPVNEKHVQAQLWEKETSEKSLGRQWIKGQVINSYLNDLHVVILVVMVV